MSFLKKKEEKKDILNVDSDDELENNMPDEFDDELNDFNDDIVDDFVSGGASLAEKNPELLKQLMNFHPFLKAKINGWLGLVWDEDQKKYKRIVGLEPIMNILCANWCSTFLETYTRDTNLVANIDRETFNNIMLDASHTLIYTIYLRMDEFEIKKQSDAKRVIEELLHSTEIIMCSIGNGKISDLLQATVNRTEHVNMNENHNSQNSHGAIRTSNGKRGFGKFLNNLMGDN